MNELVGSGKQYKIKCRRNDGYDLTLTVGKEYQTLNGVEEGIFGNSPYVTVVDDNGRNFSCLASRFEIIKEL